jgi:hypothetical protein
VIPGLVQSVLLLATQRWVGREVTVADATMTVVDVDCTLGAVGMALGQFDDVRVVVENVRLAQRTVRRVAVTCRDVHVNPGPTLVAGPVEVVVALGPEDLPPLLRRGRSLLTAEVCQGELVVRTKVLPLRRTIPLPDLPRGLVLTGVTATADEVVLTASAAVWREKLSLGQLVELLRSA